MTNSGTFRVSGVVGAASGETNVACVYLGTSTAGLGVFGLAESASLTQYNGNGAFNLTDPSGPYEIEVRSCTATTQVSFDAATSPGAMRLTRERYGFGPYFNRGNFFAVPNADERAMIVDSGTLQSGASTAFTLGANAPASGDLVGMLLWITGGQGSNQAKVIADYDPTTLQGHTDRPMTPAPNNTSTYKVIATELAQLNSLGQVKATATVTGYGAGISGGTNILTTLTGQTNVLNTGAGGVLNTNPGTATASSIDALLTASHGAGSWRTTAINFSPADSDFSIFADATWVQTILIPDVDSTGWTQMVLTIKADANADADSAALVMARVSNPGIGGDGLLILKGAAAPDPTQGSITVGAITPDTQVTWNLSAAAMDLPASATPPYAWELARWKGAVKDIIAAGKLVVKRSVRRAVAAP